MKNCLLLTVVCALMLTPLALVAQPAQPAPVAEVDGEVVIDDNVEEVATDPGKAVKGAIDAFKAGQWALGIGLVVMILVWLMRAFLWTTLPVKAVPWVALGLGAVSDTARLLISGEVWWQALLAGLVTGASALGFWSLVGKKVLPLKKDPA